MLEIDPASQDALNALTEAKVALLQQGVDDLNASITDGLSSVADPAAYAEFVSRLLEGTDFTIDLPFVSDYGTAENANTSGITFFQPRSARRLYGVAGRAFDRASGLDLLLRAE
jgi:hypothetical protein